MAQSRLGVIESPDEDSLKEAKKTQNTRLNIMESIREVYRNGVDVTAGFIVGFDNDTVTVFEVGAFAKLAELDVGRSPRALALVSSEVWVTNKADATVSIIDADTLTLTDTLGLPRASQPHGLAIDAIGLRAYIALEASGELLVIDVASGDIVHVEENAHDGAIWSLDLCPPSSGQSEGSLVTGSADKLVKYWAVEAEEGEDDFDVDVEFTYPSAIACNT